MRRLIKKFTFFSTVLAVTLVIFSTASVAKSTDMAIEPVVRTVAKTNHISRRVTKKATQKRKSGLYQTETKVRSVTKKLAEVNNSIRIRKEVTQSSTDVFSAFGFEIYDASVYLVEDSDNDGFYSDIDVEMDVDVDSGFANVYAEIYFQNDNDEWQWLATTDVFQIEGDLASDSHTVAIQLIDDMPTGYYDLLIDVYEDGFTEIVATIEAFDDADLELLPLEDVVRDNGSNSLFLEGIRMDLFSDYDGDGFFHEFDMEITVDNETFARNLQAVLYSRDTVSDWYLETSTNPIWINYGESVSFGINGIWGLGVDRPTDYYDFLVDIIDVDTGEIVDSFGPEYLALFEKPMESGDFDVAPAVVVIIDDGHSGGSGNSAFILMLLLIGLVRKWHQKPIAINS